MTGANAIAKAWRQTSSERMRLRCRARHVAPRASRVAAPLASWATSRRTSCGRSSSRQAPPPRAPHAEPKVRLLRTLTIGKVGGEGGGDGGGEGGGEVGGDVGDNNGGGEGGGDAAGIVESSSTRSKSSSPPPERAASTDAVSPALVCVFGSAPARRSSRAIPRAVALGAPGMQATCRGV